MTDATDIDIRPTPVETILDLRHAVLIADTVRTSPAFEGDREPTTIHLGGFVGTRCVACVSLMQSTWNDESAYQLRGMAVDPAWRGRGVGRQLLAFVDQRVSPATMWCNARVHAAPFYARHDWQIVSKPFDIEGVGPHVRMVRHVR